MADDLDAVIDAVAAIEDASGQATHIVGSPQSWADLSKFKQADNSNVSLVGAGTTAPSRTLVSVPVLVSNSVPDGTMLVLDRSTILSVYGSVMLARPRSLLRFGFDRGACDVAIRSENRQPGSRHQADRGLTRPADDLGAGVFEL